VDDTIRRLIALDTRYQLELYLGWPESWVEMKWPSRTATRALLMIEAGYARTPGEVADSLKVGRTTVTGILDRLEGDHLITRRIDSSDRRCFVLDLTAAGHELVHQIDSLRVNQLEQALAVLSPDDQKSLETGFTALIHALKACREKSQPTENVTKENVAR
jgi:DNA-binding MarR family transcriptional regulator